MRKHHAFWLSCRSPGVLDNSQVLEWRNLDGPVGTVITDQLIEQNVCLVIRKPADFSPMHEAKENAPEERQFLRQLADDNVAKARLGECGSGFVIEGC